MKQSRSRFAPAVCGAAAGAARSVTAGVVGSVMAVAALAVTVEAQALPEVVLQQPRLSIGVADGDSAYLFFGARQALRTEDGRIVVINHGTQQIREYDAGGRHRRTIGRSGNGPGEFRMLQRIGLLTGDSIAAYDIGNGRITVFSPDGRVARTSTVQPFGNAVLPRAFGFTRQGRLLVATDFDRNFRAGPHRDTVHFAVTDPLGVPVDTLGSYAAEESFIITAAGFATKRTIAFGRDVYAAARGERLVIGTSDDFSFDIFFAAGRTRRSYQQPHTHRRVTRDEVARADRAWLNGMPERFREDLAKRVGDFPHRETYPAFGELTAGADGSIWVQAYPAPGSPERSWTVFGADGRPRRTVRATQSLSLLDAGADYVLMRSVDEFDVERVLLFDLPPLR